MCFLSLFCSLNLASQLKGVGALEVARDGGDSGRGGGGGPSYPDVFPEFVLFIKPCITARTLYCTLFMFTDVIDVFYPMLEMFATFHAYQTVLTPTLNLQGEMGI